MLLHVVVVEEVKEEEGEEVIGSTVPGYCRGKEEEKTAVNFLFLNSSSTSTSSSSTSTVFFQLETRLQNSQ